MGDVKRCRCGSLSWRLMTCDTSPTTVPGMFQYHCMVCGARGPLKKREPEAADGWDAMMNADHAAETDAYRETIKQLQGRIADLESTAEIMIRWKEWTVIEWHGETHGYGCDVDLGNPCSCPSKLEEEGNG